MKRPIVVGVTGASGAIYAQRLIQVLLRSGHEVHAVMSRSGAQVFRQELGLEVDLDRFQDSMLGEGIVGEAGHFVHHRFDDFMTPVASGSFLTGGMVVCPCSGSTLGGIVSGAGGNLIQRAAEVHLKERRRLILVPRETPVSMVHLENLRRAAEAGAVILPASPGWYHGVRSLQDLVDFIVARILDQLEVEHRLMHRWGVDEADTGDRSAS